HLDRSIHCDSTSAVPLSHAFILLAPMEARIAIVAPSDSFSEVWPQLASFAGAEIETASCPEQLRSLQSACGVLIAAGGEERAAISIIEELIAEHAPDIVVAGVET